MGAAYFYHLTHSSVEQTLPMLLEKSRAAGWVIEVRGVHSGFIKQLDRMLWSGPPDAFLPHGIVGGEHDADQPVLLTCGETATNSANCVMAVQGADVSPAEVQDAERVCVLFDGHDGDALSKARAQWKTLVDAGCSAQYWSQESGRWEMKAER